MSTQLSPLFTWRSAIADSSLPPTQRLVALALSLHMNERGGSCFPTVATLVKETGLSERSVQGSRRALERAGWLRVTESTGRGLANEYEAVIPATETVHVLPSFEERAQMVPIKGAAPAPQDVIRTSEEKRGSPIEPESLSANDRKRDLVFEALAVHFGEPANTVERGRLNAATKLVKEALATDGVPLDDEERVSFEIGRRCSEAFLTYETYGPMAIPSNWTALGRSQLGARR